MKNCLEISRAGYNDTIKQIYILKKKGINLLDTETVNLLFPLKGISFG